MNTKFHPRHKANFVSKLTWWWIFDLLWRGNKKPLNHKDLHPVTEENRAYLQTKRLDGIWNDEKISANQRKRKPKLWKAMLRFFTWSDYGFLCFTGFVIVSASILNRYSVVKLLNALGSDFEDHDSQTKNNSFVFVWGIIFGCFLEFSACRHFNLCTPSLGIKSRAALVGLIYAKVLKCSKTTVNAGEVMELICNDSQRLVMMAERVFPFLIRKFVVLVLYTGWLLYFVGWKVIPGLLIFVFLSLFRILIAEIDLNLRNYASQAGEKRLGYLREVLKTIHSVKLNCLEHIYEEKITEAKWQEVKSKAKRWFVMSLCFSFATCAQQLSTFVTVIFLVFTDPSMLTFYNLFTIMLLFSNLSVIICTDFPTSIHFSTDIVTALTRIQLFLESCDITDIKINNCKGENMESHGNSTDGKKAVQLVTNTPYVWLDNVSCKLLKFEVSTDQEIGVLLLNDISIKISSKGMVIITGSVGSGKSLLLAAILHGELRVVKGSINHFGKLAYVSESPWVFPGTIRENILFGLSYEQEWYLETIKACQLERDFKKFPEHDLSRIGEHGATLSSGQRTRIALARAVYSRADIYLLDDPLSSLDAKVANNIFKHVLKGMLSERIIFLTTRRYFNEADYIVELNKGMVVAQGTVEELKEKVPGVRTLDNAEKVEQDTAVEESKHVESDDDDLSQTERLRVAAEGRQFGRVSFKVDAKYFTYGAPMLVLLLILLVVGAGQGLTIWTDIQVSSFPHSVNEKETLNTAVAVYTISLTIAVLFTILAKSCILLVPMRANYNIHNKMLSCLLQAPIHFFAVNPTGRILNRFSQDISNLDDLLPFSLGYFFQCAALSFGAIIMCLVTNVLLIPVVLVTITIGFAVARFFFNSAMDIKRLMSEAADPLYSHFLNTMEGLRIIRVHNKQKTFTDVMMSLIDGHHQAMFAYYTAARWFELMTDYIVIVFIGITTTIELYSINDSSSAVIAAVAILYSFNSSMYVAGMVRSTVEVQAQMTSAERVLAYTEIKPEKGRETKEQPPKEWPESGRIQFKNVSLRYYKSGPKVLKELSFQIGGSEKIGIVGRTGAGKSSLVAALMRIGETEGSVVIDTLSIEHLNLLCTRQRISVVSQSPVLFSGSIRENLNPTGEYNDSEIWNALDQIQLSGLVGHLPNKLDSVCTGGGSNFSVGQRQLFHLARVLLKRNKIIIFDEATGKVDKKTAKQIEGVIHTVFKDCTVITISHRLATIQKSDRIMVLDQGSIVEFDKEHVLLNNEKGFYSKLVEISTKAKFIEIDQS